MNSRKDADFMAQALSLAVKGQYSTTPNPQVGCVIVKEGKIVGRGYHEKAGEAHAEVHALTEAGEAAKNATVYVTLEPCSHTGKTGPCSVALVNAGVRRVVIGSKDPNPLVAGRGIKILEENGVIVNCGVLEEECERVNYAFFKRMRHQRPYVVIKLASSLDGKTALANGKSKWITSHASRDDVQHERARACAILTGANTVLKDNPRLTVRSESLRSEVGQAFLSRGKQPLRVIVDGQNRLNDTFTLFSDGNQNLVFNLSPNISISETENTKQVQASSVNGKVNLDAMLRTLACDHHISLLWVEAGASLCGALISQGLVDELILYQAPMFLGDKGRDLLELPELGDLKNAVGGRILSHSYIGNDLKYRVKLEHTKSDRF